MFVSYTKRFREFHDKKIEEGETNRVEQSFSGRKVGRQTTTQVHEETTILEPTPFFFPADEDHIRREKAKARELRQGQWWKNLRGRGKCYYCEQRFPAKSLTMDHVIPLVRGGKTTKSNVVACCKECNNKKKYLLPLEWQEYLDSLGKGSGE